MSEVTNFPAQRQAIKLREHPSSRIEIGGVWRDLAVAGDVANSLKIINEQLPRDFKCSASRCADVIFKIDWQCVSVNPRFSVNSLL